MSVHFSNSRTKNIVALTVFPEKKFLDGIEEKVYMVNLIKADSHTACRAHAVPLPCRAARGLECVFPI